MSGPNAAPGIGQQNFRTPRPFLDAVLRRLGWARFDVDLACSTSDCVGAVGLAHDVGCDSLLWNWGDFQGRGWCNPPYALTAKFAAKFCVPRLEVAALVPVALGTRWWRAYVHGVADVMWAGRLTFLRPDGTPMPATINRDVCLLHYSGAPTRGQYLLEDWTTW